ncbi:uracil-5--methyltransferase [Xylariaceae sp. FL0804]|nr:uracil-5--methyltransferase [Xylariaceae sp. FL0804]
MQPFSSSAPSKFVNSLLQRTRVSAGAGFLQRNGYYYHPSSGRGWVQRRNAATKAKTYKANPEIDSFFREHFSGKMGDVEEQELQASMSQPEKRSSSQQGSRMGPGMGQKRLKEAVVKRTKRERDMKSGLTEEVLAFDIRELLASLDGSDRSRTEEESLVEKGTEIEVDIVELSSTGDGLGLQEGSRRVYVVPFAVPGDKVKIRVYRHEQREPPYSVADFLSVVKPSADRDDGRVKCKYFASCGGCQFQMLDYEKQLQLKRRVVEKAFRNFSRLPPALIPPVGDTLGSPLQYGYRTKLTPHFDGPPGWKPRSRQPFAARPDIGFLRKGTRRTIDIEECPIATDAVNTGMKAERARMDVEFRKYLRGATLLCRESTQRVPKNTGSPSPSSALTTTTTTTPASAARVETATHTDIKTCISDNNALATEYVDDFVFRSPAGSFFQNNNSVLKPFTDYVRQHILPPSPAAGGGAVDAQQQQQQKPVQYLIDAYSGSGLFTIVLSSLFPGGSKGIDIHWPSIDCARRNAAANFLSSRPSSPVSSPQSQSQSQSQPPPRPPVSFMAADATQLFGDVTYDPDQTAVVLDPPRKGCDDAFLAQLLRFGPRRIVYVSCNVHTQARDVGVLVRGRVGGDGKEGDEDEPVATPGDGDGRSRYTIESLRGFDFFPQTGHVEGVAVLDRVEA